MAITEYKVIKAHLDSIEQAMASAIGAGFQPVGQPVMQFPAEKTVLQVVAKGASSTITDYRIIKAPIESISAAMADAIADGYQPFERPIMLYPADKTMLQAVIKGSADGGGEQVTIVVANITDASDIGKTLMTAEDEEAARDAIGAASAEDIPTVPAAPTWETLSGKPAVIAAGADQQAARAAIGAGTGNSNLELGSGADQAAPGNHSHGIGDITGLQAALDEKASADDLDSLVGRVEALETAAG